VPGLLDVLLPWTTLAGIADRPGTLGRIGPVTAAQARQLAQAAAADPAAQWRVIVTNAAGQAITVTRIRRPRRRRGPDGPAPCRDGPPPGTGLVGRITVTITQDTITTRPPDRPGAAVVVGGPGLPGDPSPPVGAGPAVAGLPAGTGPPAGARTPGSLGAAGGAAPLSPIAAAALRAAARALRRALDRAQADAAAGGCAHADQSPAYRTPPRLREYVTARDVTCRSPVCRQPAWRADLDHTRPYHQHGRTCACNLGGALLHSQI